VDAMVVAIASGRNAMNRSPDAKDVEISKLLDKCALYKNMLEDVVNELDLSDGMVEEHGPLGTPPASLVRLILERKNREIAMLKLGMKCI